MDDELHRFGFPSALFSLRTWSALIAITNVSVLVKKASTDGRPPPNVIS
jgi:hypothetical protein